MEYLTEGPSSVGLTTEMITFSRAHGLRKVHDGGGTADENITVHRIPMDQLAGWLKTKMAQGCLIDYKIYAALFFRK